MRLSILAVALVLGVGLDASSANAQRGGGGPTATCRQTDSIAVVMVRAYQNVVTSTDPQIVASRNRQQLPAVAASQVSYVTDNAICAKVEAAYTAAIGPNGTTPSLQVYVIKIGTVYVVWDPVQGGGEFGTYMTVNNKYKVLAKSSG